MNSQMPRGMAGMRIPVVSHPLRDGDEHDGHRRQLGSEVLEDLDELRHDLQHDEEEDADGEDDDGDRVDQGAFDLAAEGLVALLELGEALEDDFQGAARLARLDHVHVEAVERLRRLAHRLGQGRPALDLVADVDEAVLQRPRLALLFEDFQAAEDGQAGVLEDGELAGERGQGLHLHAADGEALSLLLDGFFLRRALPSLLHGDLRDEVAPQPDRRLRFVLAGRLDDVLDLLAGLVHRLELIGRHG